MNVEDYKNTIKIGEDCLNPEMKKIRIETKARILEEFPISDNDIMNEAFEREQQNYFKTLIDLEF